MNNQVIEEILVFKGGQICIAKSVDNELMQVIKDILPAIENWMELTLEELCGDEYWSSKTDGERRTLGRYFAYLVDKGLMPFEFANSCCQTPKRYRLK